MPLILLPYMLTLYVPTGRSAIRLATRMHPPSPLRLVPSSPFFIVVLSFLRLIWTTPQITILRTDWFSVFHPFLAFKSIRHVAVSVKCFGDCSLLHDVYCFHDCMCGERVNSCSAASLFLPSNPAPFYVEINSVLHYTFPFPLGVLLFYPVRFFVDSCGFCSYS